ncbi:MAG: protoporphyrinogen oxidase [Anaerolineae bacterium]|nr:protoporphyrinogen oxidase [Anaerolineae bacterium]
MHVTIIGGGITGLAAAFYLQQHYKKEGLPLNYTLLEGSARFGGKVVTETTGDAFVIEGGPDSFITQKPWGTQLCRDLGLAERLIPTNDDRRSIFVLNKGKLTPFPGGFRLTIPTEFIPFALSPLITPWGKLRMGFDLLIPRRSEAADESLADFIGRRLGREAVDKIADPIMAGIYMADPDQLSIQSTFPMFVEMEKQHGSLIKAMQVAKKKRAAASNGKAGKPPAMFQSLRGGMAELIESLIEQLEGDLRLNCRVTGLRQQESGLTVSLADGAPLHTDAVILTVPAYTAASLLEETTPQLAKMLTNIRYVATATVSLGYRRDEVLAQTHLDGFGFVVPKTEKRQIAACTWSSTKFNHRVPEDGVLLRTFVGGSGQEELVQLSDEAMTRLVREELADIMGLTAAPIVQRIYRWPQGTPQYDVGHLERVTEMERLAAAVPGLYLAGSAYRGIGLPDCISSARTVVEKITAAASHPTPQLK